MPKNRFAVLPLMLLCLFVTSCGAVPAVPTLLPGTPTSLPPTQTLSSTAMVASTPLVQAAVPLRATPIRPTRTPEIGLGKLGQIDRDVTYCTTDGIALKMDVYHPLKMTNQPAPVLVNVHGGAWMFGDKLQSETLVDIPELLNRGYLVAAVDYRLAPAYKFPAQIEDVKCAVRYLRANATTYHLDANRIGAWGCSAGGHLVAMLGLTDSQPEFDGSGAYRNESSRVQAVVAMSAPADLTMKIYASTRAQEFAHVFGALSTSDSILKRSSPIDYVSKNAPPFLIIGGERDTIVPPQQSELLYERLKQAGDSASLLLVKNAHHCLPETQPPMEPSRAEVSQQIADFFDRELR